MRLSYSIGQVHGIKKRLKLEVPKIVESLCSGSQQVTLSLEWKTAGKPVRVPYERGTFTWTYSGAGPRKRRVCSAYAGGVFTLLLYILLFADAS